MNNIFIKWAKKINPQGTYFQLNLNNFKDLEHNIFKKRYDNIFIFAVWDYFLYPEKIVDLLKNITGKNLFFEGHADGQIRIENDIIEKGKIYKSWKYILNNILKVKNEFIGMTDNGRRPFWKCSF
jgi:hypothetical protein